MPQYILLQSYVGLSSFTYDVTCSGRELDPEEAKQAGLVTDGDLRRNRQSDYTITWYEIEPDTEIRVVTREGYDDPTQHVFIVPVHGLDNPPISLDDPRTGMWLHKYLEQVCVKK